MTVALILGGADCVYRDFEAALDLGEFDGVVGANHVGITWPGIFDAWVSLHPDRLKRPWVASRRRRGLPDHKAVITSEETERRFPGQENAGSSGLFAVKVALVDLGFDRVVLCGVPLTRTAHFDDPTDWKYAESYHEGWTQALPHIRDRVRSFGGFTQQLLGAPDAAWIAGDS